jgi:hypothetical protein
MLPSVFWLRFLEPYRRRIAESRGRVAFRLVFGQKWLELLPEMNMTIGRMQDSNTVAINVGRVFVA